MARRRARCGLPQLDRFRSSNATAAQAPASPGAGFTLVEVVFAIFVLTVGLVALAQLLIVSVRMHQLSRNTEVATQLAETKFEELMKLNFTTEPSVQITGADSLNNDVANYFDVPDGLPFTRRWLVEAGPVDRTRRVTVRMVPLQTDLLIYKPVQLTTIIRQW